MSISSQTSRKVWSAQVLTEVMLLDFRWSNWNSVQDPKPKKCIQKCTNQSDDVKCMLARYVLHDDVKHACNHHDAVNRIEICLKTRPYPTPVSRFVVEYTIECSPVCDVTSKVTEDHGHRVDNPCCCKYRRTVHADTFYFANKPISWPRACDVAERFIKVMQIRCLSSRLLEVESRWNLCTAFSMTLLNSLIP